MTAPTSEAALPPGVRIRVDALIAAGALALALVSLHGAPEAQIGAPWSGLAGPAAPFVGMIFWGALTLVASSVSAELPEGTRLVWVLAPLVATMNLGGPLVAGWVAALATTEPRELRGEVPWYGVVNNHANFVLAAIGGASVMAWVRAVAPAGLDPAFVDLLATLLGGCTFELTNIVATLMVVRTGHWQAVLGVVRSRSFVAADGAQLALGWLVAQTYLGTGWWAPLVFALPALLAWQAFDHDRLRWAAGHDPLTDLANRREFDARLADRVAAARRSAAPSVLLIVDLDDFKSVNDRLGHEAGDAVLRVVARRLQAATRGDDHVARLGGDEFAVILSATAHDAALAIVERLQAALGRPIELDGATVTVGASIGMAAIDGTTGGPADLLRSADRAMFHAKGSRDGSTGANRAGSDVPRPELLRPQG